jgi:hypothetical protein
MHRGRCARGLARAGASAVVLGPYMPGGAA